jgi:hypothetical protein
MVELAVKHVWVKFGFHMAWRLGVGGTGTEKTVSSGRALGLRHSYVH